MKLKEKIKKIIELDKKFIDSGKHKIGRTTEEIKGYECCFNFELKRMESLLKEENE